MMNWHNSDPRHVWCDRYTIVIVRPSLSGGLEAGVGDVETQHGYSVLTSFDDHKLVAEGDTWDPSWRWTEIKKEEP